MATEPPVLTPRIACANRLLANPEQSLTRNVISAAIEVHRELGPGLLENAYQTCLCHEFKLRDISFRQQVELPIAYKGVKLECGYRADFIIENRLVLELKCVEAISPIHEAQLLTYLRLSGLHVGLLLNFNVPVLKEGIRRRVL